MTHHLDSDGVVERIYDTVSDGSRWGEALLEAVEYLEADAMLLVYANLAVGGPAVVESTGFKTEVLEEYSSRHLRDDELLRESMDGPAGIIVSSGRRSPPGSFRETTVYRRLLWPCELRHLTGAAVLNTPRVHSSVWVGRSENRGEFSSRDLRPFSELVPHFGRAMAVYHRLHQAEIQVDLATGAIDRVAVGIVLLDVGGVPILVNREAKRIAASGDGFVLGDRCVAAERPGDAVRLRSLIRQVGGHTSAEGPDSKTRGGAVRLTRSSGRSDYHVVVMPLPRRCQPIDGSGAVAVVFVSDPEKSQSPVDFLFGDLYNLTDAEARLVCQLLEGRGLTAAAEQLGLSRNTVHSQLASVFQKTGTRRQGELLHLLLGGIAPVEAPDPTSGIYETDDLRENPTH